jgi:hypothetical protein
VAHDPFRPSQYVVFGPRRITPEACQVGPHRISLGSIVAFDIGGKIRVGMVNEGNDTAITIWCGDITYEVEFPAIVLFKFQGESVPEMGLMVGRDFNSWKDFADESARMGAEIDMTGMGSEDIFG